MFGTPFRFSTLGPNLLEPFTTKIDNCAGFVAGDERPLVCLVYYYGLTGVPKKKKKEHIMLFGTSTKSRFSFCRSLFFFVWWILVDFQFSSRAASRAAGGQPNARRERCSAVGGSRNQIEYSCAGRRFGKETKGGLAVLNALHLFPGDRKPVLYSQESRSLSMDGDMISATTISFYEFCRWYDAPLVASMIPIFDENRFGRSGYSGVLRIIDVQQPSSDMRRRT